MRKQLAIRRRADEKYNASRARQSGFSAQADDNYIASKDDHCEEIDNARRDEKSVFPPRAEKNDNGWQMPQENFKEWGSYSLPLSLDRTKEKDIGGSFLSLQLPCPPEKKFHLRLWGKDLETENTCDHIRYPLRLPGNEKSQSEQIITDEKWLETLRFRLNQNEKERQIRIRDGKEECDNALEESEEKKKKRREILEALEKGHEARVVAKRIFDLACYSEEHANSIVEDLYGIKNNDVLITFEQKMPGRMVVGNRWKRTDVGFKAGGISVAFEAKELRTITHRSHADENCHQSSASNPCNRREQLISRPSKEKYSYLPHFHEELGTFMAGGFGNSEQVEGFLVGIREKLQEICRELGSHSRARSPNEVHEKEIILIDDSDSPLTWEFGSDSGSNSPDNIYENEAIDGSVLSLRHNPSPEKKKLCTLWDIDIYEEDFGNSPEDMEPSKPMSGSSDDQDI